MTECCGFLIDSINDQSTVNLEIDGDGAFFLMEKGIWTLFPMKEQEENK